MRWGYLLTGIVIGAAIIGGQLEIFEQGRRISAQVRDLKIEVESRDRNRAQQLLRHMRQVNRPFVLFIGDSIVERADLPDQVCGFPIVNAGIGGSRVANLIPFVDEIRGQGSRVAATVVAVGVNDAQSRFATTFAAGFRLLLDSLPDVPTIVATPTRIDVTMPIGSRMDAARYAAIVVAVKEAAAVKGVQLADLNALDGLQTVDGVHLSDSAYPAWIAALMGPLTDQLACGKTAKK
jgi:hypothetical protein